SEGQIEGLEYYKTVSDLPQGSRVLLVGDAKAFYFRTPVDYAVVFNVNPLGEIVRTSSGPVEMLSRMRAHGWTHLLVNWPEVARLRNSRYGFDPAVTPDLFDALCAAGLALTDSFTLSESDARYVELYAI